MSQPDVSQSSDFVPRVAVIGGGLAGLSAAAALAEKGVAVELFEARRWLGGRASSFTEPESGRCVDRCQHVAMGCCTALLDFLRRTGLAETFREDGRLHFIGPEGQVCRFEATGWLPAPLHLLPGFWRLKYLSPGSRLRIMRTLARLARGRSEWDNPSETIGTWLLRQGESAESIERFWAPVVLGALSEPPERASVSVARKVFVDGFLSSRWAYAMWLPQEPLREIFDRRLSVWLEERNVLLHRRTRIARLEGDTRRVDRLVLPDGSVRSFDAFIVAVPWYRVQRLLAPELATALPGLAGLEKIEPGAITSVHLRFDRPITELPHAAMVGRQSQWVFRGEENRYQVLLSGSHTMALGSRAELIERTVSELGKVFPAVGAARLLDSRVVVEPRAVFRPLPGSDALRPTQKTPVSNLFFAGDWTSTGWPATMESAIRSGRAAAEAIGRATSP
ncbi:MAG: FAD-dependent oxidoreductase [Pirellulales bacterium]|nr:FAD-dependent oxidoreductase [Pirellulales bacterium]